MIPKKEKNFHAYLILMINAGVMICTDKSLRYFKEGYFFKRSELFLKILYQRGL